MAEGKDRETEAYLARIRQTIAESSRLVEQATLRMAETDRLLESQGLTREQVMGMRFTDEQREAVNRELARRGLEPLEPDPPEKSEYSDCSDYSEYSAHSAHSTDLAARQRKFGMMMKPFQI